MTDNLKNDAAALDALLQQTKEAGFDFLHRLATVPTSVDLINADGRPRRIHFA